MSNEKKNLDRLFQEKFRDFEVTPQEKVWDNIRKELTRENDKPVLIFPFWLKLSGVAAALVAIVLVGSLWFSAENNIPVVHQNSTEFPEHIPVDKQENNTIQAVTPEPEKIQENVVVETKKTSKNQMNSSRQSSLKNSAQEMVLSEKPKNFSPEERVEKENTITQDILPQHRQTEQSDLIKSSDNQTDASVSVVQNENIIKSENTSADKEKTKSIFEDIAKQENDDPVKPEEDSKSLKDKIAIRPNIAPIYYNSMSGGSAVDPQLAGNKVEGEVTMSYGIDVSYAINDRISVRTGVNKVNMGYHTNDIAVFPSSTGMGNNAIKNNPQSGNIGIVKAGDLNGNPSENYGENAVMYSYGRLGQQMEYIEVPLEIEFAVLNTRFGINLVGGASTLFLNDDAVRVQSAMGSMDLGRASNLNNLSFTTNFGVGFDYDLTKKLNVNLEPTFKYQLNAHSGDVGGFKPYYFGLYSGMSFRF